MREDSAGLIEINGITLLAGFLVVLIVVMGVFTMSGAPQELPSAQTDSDERSFRVVVTESSVGLENLDASPNVYSQLVIYLDGDRTNQQVALEEDDAVGDDGDRLFERGEVVRRQLEQPLSVGAEVGVKVVNTGESEILYSTNVTARAG